MLKAISTITNAIGALNYKGTWNASTNTPTLADGTGAKGDYYVVSTAGTQTFDGVQLFFGLGDWIVYNGAVWQRVEGGSDGNFANVTMTSTDAGATASPLLDLYRDSASPAASDTLGEIEFNGEDSAGNKQQYAVIHASILSPTSTAEAGQIHFETATAGVSTEKMIIGTTNLVINDIGAIFNVRIEGDTDANLFFTDATNSRVGVGTITPDVKFQTNGIIKSGATGTNGEIQLARTSDGLGVGKVTMTESTQIMNYNNLLGSGVHSFTINTVERARIDSSAGLLVGTTSALISSARVGLSVLAPTGAYVTGSFANDGGASAQTIETWNKATSGDNIFIAFGTEASFTQRGSISYNRAGGLTVYNTTSDYRAKDIYSGISDSGSVIDSVPVYIGKMKGATQERPMFLAHETPIYAHTGEKDAVDKDGKPVYQQMDASSLIPVMWAEIQSLRKRLTKLESI